MMDTLPGNLGRYVGQYSIGQYSIGQYSGTQSNSNSAAKSNTIVTIADLIGAGSKARQTVLSACATLLSNAQNGNYTAIPADVQAVVSALRLANPAPNQAIDTLLELQSMTTYGTQLSASLTSINNALINLFRRNAVSAAVSAAASSTSTYQPISQEDAAKLRQTICNALDVEIQTAGDHGEDASYNALRALRVAVVQDLANRGSNLSTTQEVITPAPVALLVTAQRLYQDSTRYDQLLNEANPIHPAFAPTQFKALLS
jgi:prophage DNA circulation protein